MMCVRRRTTIITIIDIPDYCFIIYRLLVCSIRNLRLGFLLSVHDSGPGETRASRGRRRSTRRPVSAVRVRLEPRAAQVARRPVQPAPAATGPASGRGRFECVVKTDSTRTRMQCWCNDVVLVQRRSAGATT